MSVLDWFKKRFRDEGKHYIYAPLASSRVRYSDGSSADEAPLVAGTHYFRLWLTEMFLKNDRDWFANWHPAVHSAIKFTFGSQTKLVTKIAGPSNLKNLDPHHLDRVIQQNHQLTTLMPFNGGTVEVSCGMLAMEGRNDVKSFIKVLGDFSNLLMVPQLSAAMKVAEPLADGIAELVNATDGKLMVGLEQTFSSDGGGAESVLRPGYIAVILAEKNQVDPSRLWVREDSLYYGKSIDDSEHLTGWNYMLLRIEGRTERDDWDSLESIQTPYGKAIEALQLQQLDEAKSWIRAAIAAAYASPDLTKVTDRRRVIKLLQERYAEAEADLGPGAYSEMEGSLSSLLGGAMSAAEAASKPEITEQEAFEGIR